MSKHLKAITCDACNVVMAEYPNNLDTGLFYTRKSKTGRTLTFCSQSCKESRNNNKKKDQFDPGKLITDYEAAKFIEESNAIEEIHLPFEEYRKGWIKKNSPLPEIKGHVRSLNYILKQHKKDINIDMIEKVHRMLMRGLLLPYQTGLRRDLVKVGNRLCPYPIEIKPLLEKWCSIVNSFTNPSENDIWQSHLAFEYIHPFLDGNGRSGRLFWLWLRYKHGYGYGCVYNSTKHEEYYPQFKVFSWDDWSTG